MRAASIAPAVADVGLGWLLGLKVASQIAPLGDSVGFMGCCAEDVDVVVDGVVVSFRLGTPLATEVANEVAVGVYVDGSLMPRGCRPVFGDSGRLAPSNLKNRSRTLGFPSDIFRGIAVLSSAGGVGGREFPSS